MGIDDPLHVTEGWRRLRHAEAKIRGLETELEHWKANHAEAVRLKRNCHEYKRAFLDALDEVKAERDRLKAENERLRRALIPFKCFADALDPDPGDERIDDDDPEYIVTSPDGDLRIDLGLCREARAALKGDDDG